MQISDAEYKIWTVFHVPFSTRNICCFPFLFDAMIKYPGSKMLLYRNAALLSNL